MSMADAAKAVRTEQEAARGVALSAGSQAGLEDASSKDARARAPSQDAPAFWAVLSHGTGLGGAAWLSPGAVSRAKAKGFRGTANKSACLLRYWIHTASHAAGPASFILFRQ